MHDPELDRFKRDIHFVQYAIERYGYTRDARESSRASHVLRREASDDKLVVRRSDDGHWTYFSVRDGRDNGTIVDFVQRRAARSLGDVRQELRQWLGTPRPDFEPWRQAAPADRPQPPRDFAQLFASARSTENSAYLNARGIRPETLRDPRFAGSWLEDARNNALFAHRDDAGVVTGFEIKSRGFTGFSAGGHKTAWRSATRPDDRALVIAESAIDALSYHQLRRGETAHVRYLSTGGAPSRSQIELVDKAVAQMAPASRIVAAVDADPAGTELAQRLRGLTERHPHVSFQRDSPAAGKDWNDLLQRLERDYIRSLPLAVRNLHPSMDRGR